MLGEFVIAGCDLRRELWIDVQSRIMLFTSPSPEKPTSGPVQFRNGWSVHFRVLLFPIVPIPFEMLVASMLYESLGPVVLLTIHFNDYPK